MNMKLMWSLLLVLLFIQIDAQSQKTPQFRPPLDIPLRLSGSFGELRSNHFHSGIDIKTGGVTGVPVHAVADGYVYRIKIGDGGYGKALYVRHPGGYVSVYGHLSSFASEMAQRVKAEQYKQQRFFVEIFPEKGEFPVKKGEVIAFSGNSGSSAGPHLHFEMRNARTESPLNPLKFKGIEVRDHRHPLILQLAVYPVDDTSLINGKHDTVRFSVAGTGENCYLKGDPVLKLHGRVSFGLRTYDLMDKVYSKNGIYALTALIDTMPFFGISMDSTSFFTTRYINSLIDYPWYRKKGKRFIRTEIDTNNKLSIYTVKQNSGIVCLNDEKEHLLLFKVNDFNGNSATLKVRIKGNTLPVPEKIKKESQRTEQGVFIKYDQPKTVKKSRFSVEFPAHAFYRSFYFTSATAPSVKGALSKTVVLHNPCVPVHKQFVLRVVPDTIPKRVFNKMYVAQLQIGGGDTVAAYVGGAWKNGRLVTPVREFGRYTVMADTLPPTINVLYFPQKGLKKGQILKIKIEDKQSGIKSYRAEVNGHWFLMEYDRKNKLLKGVVDEHIPKGKSRFQLVVRDYLNNKAVLQKEIER